MFRKNRIFNLSFAPSWIGIYYAFFSLLLLLAWLVPRGAREGGGSSIRDLTNRGDSAGFLLPLLTPYDPTPDGTDMGNLWISLLTLLVTLLSIQIILRSIDLTDYHLLEKIFIHFLFSCMMVFVMQNVRDAFVLSFGLLAFSLVIVGLKRRSIGKSFFLPIVLSFVCLLLSVQAKYVTAFCLTLLITATLTFLWHKGGTVRTLMVAVMLATVITLIGVIFDKTASRIIGLQPGNQQYAVFFMDHAAMLCWSENQETRNKALEGLRLFMITADQKDICLSFRPNAVNSLLTGGVFRETVPPPLRDPTFNDGNNIKLLQDNWIQLIRLDPVDFIQNKLMFSTQILMVGDVFLFFRDEYPKRDILSLELETLSDLAFIMFGWIFLLISKSYLFSLIVLLVLVVSLVMHKPGKLERGELDRNLYLSVLLLCLLAGIVVLSVGYVADQARYTFPITAFSYLLIVIRHSLIKLKPIDSVGFKDYESN